MTIHSNDGYTAAQRLTRLCELSAKNRAMVFNNLGHLVNENTLRDAFRTLDGSKARGLDGVSKEEYGKNLDGNLKNLIHRIRTGAYRPQPCRIVEIPKADGSTRALAISCVEDKLVQSVVASILGNIYEPLFLPCSYGFRPKRSAHDALRDTSQAAYERYDGAVVEMDIRKCFDSVPHPLILDFLSQKISDKRFLSLIETLMRTPVFDGKETRETTVGVPQGAVCSPILANIFLHHVLDEWFTTINKSHFGGGGALIRFADDAVFFFRTMRDGERFFKVLPKRLAKFGLTMHEMKSRLLPSGATVAKRLAQAGERIPTFAFLGFTCYWDLSRKGTFWRLKFKSRSDRMRNVLKRIKAHLTKSRNTSNVQKLMRDVYAVMRGWFNYHAISDNQRRLRGFYHAIRRLIYHWCRRRGSGRTGAWERAERIMAATGLPPVPRLKKLFPTQRQAYRPTNTGA